MKPFLAIFILTVSLTLSKTLAGENPVTLWGKQYGFALEAMCVTADKAGNCLIAGTTGDSLSNSYAGKKDIFLRKFDPAGNILWTINIGSSEDDYCYAVVTDLDGNCILAGKTFGNLASENLGNSDAVTIKVNPSGDIIWKKQFGTSKADDFLFIIFDDQGNYYISGSTAGDFDGKSNGGSDAIMVKLNNNGDILWQKQYGTSANEKAEFIALDKDNSSYFVLSSKDIFKYDNQGNPVQKYKYNIHKVTGITIDDSLNIYIGGTTGITDGSKAVLIKYNQEWIKQWERTFGSGPWTGINSMWKFQDGTDDILVGVCQNYPNCMGVCRRYDHDGNAKWIYTLQKTGSSICGHHTAIDGSGNCYLTGFTDGNIFNTKIKAQELFLSKITLSGQTDVNKRSTLPEKIELNQNYPNPFNPSTTISYSLSQPSKIKLTIYNVAGEEITTLQNTFQNAGEYSLVWDAKDSDNKPVSSGIYFYMLTTDNSILLKKMIMVK